MGLEDSLFGISAKDLRNLPDACCVVDPKLGLGLLHVGPKVSHPIKESLSSKSFFLAFQLDPDILNKTQNRRFLSDLIKACVLLPLNNVESYDVLNKDVDTRIEVSEYCLLSCRLLPIQGIEKARKILAEYAPESIDNNLPPLVVAVQPEQDEDNSNRCYLGQSFSTNTYEILTVDEIKTTSQLEPLIFKKVPGAKVNICAQYDLWGSSEDDSGSRASLFLRWKGGENSFPRLLGNPPPKIGHAHLTIRGCHENEHATANGDHLPDKAIQLLLKVAQISLDNKLTDTDMSKWNAYVESFISSAATLSTSTQNREKKNKTDPERTNKASGVEENRTRAVRRTDQDFTELFWQEIVEKGDISIVKILEALKLVSKALRAGKLLPFIHKTNNTFLGKFCRQAVQIARHQQYGSQESKNESDVNIDISKWNKVADMLEAGLKVNRTLVVSKIFEIGSWKVKRDIRSFLCTVGISDDSIEKYIYSYLKPDKLCSNSAGMSPELQQVSRLIAVRDILQISSIARTFHCPQSEVQTLLGNFFSNSHESKDYLRAHKTENGHAKYEVNQNRSFTTYMIPLHSNLGLMNYNTAGSDALPQPSVWKIAIDSKNVLNTYLFTPKESSFSTLAFGKHIKTDSVDRLVEQESLLNKNLFQFHRGSETGIDDENVLQQSTNHENITRNMHSCDVEKLRAYKAFVISRRNITA